jgi:hypothetical protein
VRNQRLKASQVNPTSSNLTDVGWAAVRTRAGGLGELYDRFHVAGPEATVNACGVAVAMPQGHSWTPPLSNGSKVNVGTIPTVPPLLSARAEGGKARCRLMLSEWGGGPVVVRDRESRSHGEGVQCVVSRRCIRGGRW